MLFLRRRSPPRKVGRSAADGRGLLDVLFRSEVRRVRFLEPRGFDHLLNPSQSFHERDIREERQRKGNAVGGQVKKEGMTRNRRQSIDRVGLRCLWNETGKASREKVML